MKQQFHFWVSVQRKQNHYLKNYICIPTFIAGLFIHFFKDFNLFLDRGEGREKERERKLDV